MKLAPVVACACLIASGFGYVESKKDDINNAATEDEADEEDLYSFAYEDFSMSFDFEGGRMNTSSALLEATQREIVRVTMEPSSQPSSQPSESSVPSSQPSSIPSSEPSVSSVPSESYQPSDQPSLSSVPSSQPSSKPSSQPSVSSVPSSQPSSKPSSQPSVSSVPSQSSQPSVSATPIALSIDFPGIIDAVSTSNGTVKLFWYPPSLIGASEDDEVQYNIFASPSEEFDDADFSNSTVDHLKSVFSSHPGFFYSNTTNFTATLNLIPGRTYKILVTAEVDGVDSSNRGTTNILVSSVDPQIRDDINLTGVFVPTMNLSITINATDISTDGGDRVVFDGAVSATALNLTVGDYITGITSGIQPFVRKIVGVETSSSDYLSLLCVFVPIEVIFAELDIDVCTRMVSADASQIARRLIFGAIGDFFEDVGGAVVDFVEDVGGAIVDGLEFIGDAIVEFGEGVVDRFTEFVEFIATGTLTASERYELLNIDRSYQEEFSTERPTNSSNFTASLVLEGRVRVFAEIVAKMSVGLSGFEASVSASAGAALGAKATVDALYEGSKTKEFNLFMGKRVRKIFFVGPIPVEVYYEPNVDMELAAAARVEASGFLGVDVETNPSLTLGVNTDDGIFTDFVEPRFDPVFSFDFNSEANLTASAGIILSIKAGIYEGLLEGSLGVKGELTLDAGVKTNFVGEDPPFDLSDPPPFVLSVEKFDLDFGLSFPVVGTAVWGAVDLFETNIYETVFPILTLPTIDFEIIENTCNEQDQNGNNITSLLIEAVEGYNPDALIDNGFNGNGVWYPWEETVEEWDVTRDVNNSRILLLERPSAEGVGEGRITYAKQPNFPPIFKVLERTDLSALVEEYVERQCDQFGDAGVSCLRDACPSAKPSAMPSISLAPTSSSKSGKSKSSKSKGSKSKDGRSSAKAKKSSQIDCDDFSSTEQCGQTAGVCEWNGSGCVSVISAKLANHASTIAHKSSLVAASMLTMTYFYVW